MILDIIPTQGKIENVIMISIADFLITAGTPFFFEFTTSVT